jgi:hypothetical protein
VLPVESALRDPQYWNRYAYALNNPLTYTDPDGRLPDAFGDLANVGMGLSSFVANVAAGNATDAAVDAVGILLDGAAFFVPVVPGGAGTIIKTGRVAERVKDGVQSLDRAADAAKRLGTLTRAGDNACDSAVGLRCAGTDRAGLNRVQHVLRHAEAYPSRATHSVFNVGRNKVLGLVDEAWGMRGSPLTNDPGAYIVPMGRTVGTAGENAVKIIVRPGTNEIITAYPVVVP